MSPNTLICQARPIENFWGCLAQKVYEGGRAVTTEHRIHRKLRKFDLKCMESLMRGVKAKVKSIGQHGVFSLFKKIIEIFDFKMSALAFASSVICLNNTVYGYA